MQDFFQKGDAINKEKSADRGARNGEIVEMPYDDRLNVTGLQT